MSERDETFYEFYRKRNGRGMHEWDAAERQSDYVQTMMDTCADFMEEVRRKVGGRHT